ncbi:hypothetical protein, partial [Crossiella cryophila]|uniref:hypothetical protein n=1 Tax=Crossiella cryophila TaxID=43355 RepID=UPI0031ECFC24
PTTTTTTQRRATTAPNPTATPAPTPTATQKPTATPATNLKPATPPTTTLKATAALLTALTTTACTTTPPTPPSPPTTATATTPPPAPNPQARPDLCTNLDALTAVAGPTFTLATAALLDGETPQERTRITQAVDNIAHFSIALLNKTPKEIDNNLRQLAYAASAAKTALTNNIPTPQAISPLETREITTARNAITAYRGPC